MVISFTTALTDVELDRTRIVVTNNVLDPSHKYNCMTVTYIVISRPWDTTLWDSRWFQENTMWKGKLWTRQSSLYPTDWAFYLIAAKLEKAAICNDAVGLGENSVPIAALCYHAVTEGSLHKGDNSHHLTCSAWGHSNQATWLSPLPPLDKFPRKDIPTCQDSTTNILNHTEQEGF